MPSLALSSISSLISGVFSSSREKENLLVGIQKGDTYNNVTVTVL
jgi:hypothetical protein